MKFFLEVNTTKKVAIETATNVKLHILNLDHEVVKHPDESDIILSLGGDGTMINTWYKYYYLRRPVFGINCGHLGFLTECDTEDFKEKIDKIVAGDYTVEKRIWLKGTLNNPKHQNDNFLAVNEFVIGHADKGLFEYSIRVKDQTLQHAKGDGIICATPTGSTAYALSAGGSLIEPTVNGVELVPLCPQSLMNRSIILPLQQKIDIIAHTNGYLQGDGRYNVPILAGDVFTIERCSTKLLLACVDQDSFIKRIARKF